MIEKQREREREREAESYAGLGSGSLVRAHPGPEFAETKRLSGWKKGRRRTLAPRFAPKSVAEAPEARE